MKSLAAAVCLLFTLVNCAPQEKRFRIDDYEQFEQRSLRAGVSENGIDSNAEVLPYQVVEVAKDQVRNGTTTLNTF